MKHKDKPLIHTLPPERGGIAPPWLQTWWTQLPVKWVQNTRNNMDLLHLYSHGELKYEDTGVTCSNCVHYYPTPLSKMGGRCRARRFIEVHPDTPACDKPKGWTDPVSGIHLEPWPKCEEFILKERLSRR